MLMVSGLGTLFVCGLGSGLFFMTGIPQAANELESQRQRAKQSGLDLTFDRFLKDIQIPDEENAAVTLAPFLKAVEEIKPPKSNPPSVLDDVGSRENVAKLAAFLPTLEIAKSKPKCIFSKPSKDALSILFPELSTIKKAVKLFVAKAKYAAEDGDLNEAKKSYSNALYLSSISDSSHTLIGELVQIATSSIILTQIQKDLPLKQSNAAWVEMFKEVVENVDDRPDVQSWIQIEHMFGTDAMRLLREKPSSLGEQFGMQGEDKTLILIARLPRAVDANEMRIHEAYSNLIDSLPKDEYDFEGIRRSFAKLASFGPERDLSYIGCRIILPVFGSVIEALNKRSASRTTLLESIAYLQGKNPSLSGPILKGNRYQDTDGKSIRIVPKSDGTVLFYSFGSNKTDDGGVNDPKASPRKDDFTVKLKRK